MLSRIALPLLLACTALAACGEDGSGPGAQPTQLAFTTQPGTADAGQVVPPFRVSIQDASGETVADADHTVTLSLADNPSSAALGGTTAVGASGGVATFSDIRISAAGNGYSLRATSPGLAAAISAPFDISSGEPGSLTGRIVFTSERSGRRQLYAVEPEGGELIKVSPDTITEGFPVASPDGRLIVFLRQEYRTILRNVNDAGEAELVDLRCGWGHAWSPDGEWLAARIACPSMRRIPLRVARANGMEAHDIAIDPDIRFGPTIRGYSWAPDAMQLVYSTLLEGGLPGSTPADLGTIGRDGGGFVRLTDTDSINETEPAWSPAGDRIAFCVGLTSDPCTGGLEAVRSDGTERTRITDIAPSGTYVWSPDGSRLALGSNSPDGLYVIPADGGEPRTVFPGFASSPVWSPDGTRLAFVTGTVGTREIHVVGADGTNLRRLTDDAEDDYAPTWVPGP